MHHIELRTRLDQSVLDEILALIEAAARIEGHRPVGEHKYQHLKVGASDWVGVMAYEGTRLVGYAHTRWHAAGERPRMAVEVVAHPDYYGDDVAPILLNEARALLGRAGGGLMHLWVHRVDDPRKTLAARLGFKVQRELAYMTRSLRERLTDIPLPAGVTIGRYREGVDDEAFLRVNNAAFDGHPENGGWDLAEFAERRGRDWFDPAGLLLAWRADELVGFHWTKWHSHEGEEVPAHEPVGEVYVLAVAPWAQGLGLGRALLLVGLAHLRDRGCVAAELYVDCTNTSAVRLYESEGFVLAYREICYQDEIDAYGSSYSGSDETTGSGGGE